jgi:hypothetical protein
MVTCGRGGSDKTDTKSAAPALPLSMLLYRFDLSLLALRLLLLQKILRCNANRRRRRLPQLIFWAKLFSSPTSLPDLQFRQAR